ncbi:E3 ubiquitin-protein ligase NEDD4-like [Megalobrama amblycephala]|uniref:E3 ubiquitin-protein ligase NEDD4-like n=1 Tax=Megalobrama amblycephala TaxID=75352 RepID=UPI002013FAC6|nr:E3 ubiquitin-protein ligase NEDD4-like [Megalobrama amblycephala]XP_048046151.1 E3 ubiquitin-protein ligase NEDD4-like [Megalobrama amblycephala]XP_048046152.1 E3 ubiquitin-protein ligase NEDD4-like [Megalobrama amblycephala]
MADSKAAAEAVNILRNLLCSPVLINTIANSVDSSPSTSQTQIDSEIGALFRPTHNVDARNTNLTQHVTLPSTPGSENQTPRFIARRYSSWKPNSKGKRPKPPYHRVYNKDIILLTHPKENNVVKQRTKQKLYEKGHIISAFEFDKTWDYRTVMNKMHEAFKGKIPCGVGLEILLPCGNKLVAPTFHEGQKLDGNVIQKVFKRASLYLRPSEPLQSVYGETSDSEENYEEEAVDTGGTDDEWPSHSSKSSKEFVSASAKTSTAELPATESHGMAISISTHVEQPSTNAQASSSSQQETPQSNSPTPRRWQNDYGTYINLINDSLDEDEDEELYTAIIASIEDQTRPKEDASLTDILKELGEKIRNTGICKFNINRAAVLDGAIRGFRRVSYNPNHTMCIKFSDDKGTTEEAVDLGGPRREFLRLLMEALSHSEMFEGHEGHLNLALDSFAVRDDRYFFAGRSIAVSLVHGGPPPCFLSETLFSCLVKGPEMSRPVIEDIADNELYEKLKRISESRTVEELQTSAEPLTDYLSHAGCLRPLTSLMDKNPLLEDVLMFQVIHRVRGPFERFRDGLKTLGVLQKIQQHPEAFHAALCYTPRNLSADIMDGLFEIRWSETGSNRRANENRVVTYWRDYLQDAEEEEGPTKLEDILTFATGSNVVPPIGFSPQPSLEFLHNEGKYPVANTCINCLRLPIHKSYEDFKNNMDFGIQNTQGFGMR